MDSACPEEPGAFDEEVRGFVGDVVLVGEKHLEFVDDGDYARHDGFRILQPILADALHPRFLEARHPLFVDAE